MEKAIEKQAKDKKKQSKKDIEKKKKIDMMAKKSVIANTVNIDNDDIIIDKKTF